MHMNGILAAGTKIISFDSARDNANQDSENYKINGGRRKPRSLRDMQRPVT